MHPLASVRIICLEGSMQAEACSPLPAASCAHVTDRPLQNPWGAAQRRLRQPDGKMALDGELLRKFWSALLTAFPSVTSKPTLVRCRGQCPVFGHKFVRLPPPPHIPRGSFSRCERVQLTKVCACACGSTLSFLWPGRALGVCRRRGHRGRLHPHRRLVRIHGVRVSPVGASILGPRSSW